MGVMECSRRGCENIMCDEHISEIGYICHDCKEELKTIDAKSMDDVRKFMDTNKNDTKYNDDEGNFVLDNIFSTQ